MSVLRRLNLDYHPTYENRANYDELVKEAVSLMKGDFELQGTKWDTGPFTRETWLGHWQDDSNYYYGLSSPNWPMPVLSSRVKIFQKSETS